MSESTVKYDKIFVLHVMITIFFMFGFGFLPAPAPITPVGMRCLGIFIGVIYAWTTTSLLWPSFLGMVALCWNGDYPMSAFLPVSFANSTVVFIMLIFVFAKVIDDSGLVKWLASWLMSRKIVEGRPWLFSYFLLLGAFIGGIFVSSFATAIIFWSILYAVCRKFGFKPYDKYPSLMILGIVFCAATLGGTVMPFRLTALVLIGTLQTVAPEFVISSGQYIAYFLPLGLAVLTLYLGICKYIFRVDLTPMKNISAEFVAKEDLILNKRQKWCAFFLALTVILLIAVDMTPATWPIKHYLSSLTTTGVLLLILVAMMLVRVEGKPLLDYTTAARGIMWDTVYLFAFVLPFSAFLTSDATGLKAFILQYLSPIFQGHSPLIFMVLVLVIGMVVSNVANNAVLAVIFINICTPICISMGINPLPLFITQLFTIQLAYMTPAASAPAAFVLANSEWIKPSRMYKYILVILLLLLIVGISLGLPFAAVLFGGLWL